MRARLLDLGTVAPVRAESIHRAVAAGLAADGDPVVVLVQPAAPYVSIGCDAAGTEPASSPVGDLPVLRRETAGGPWLHGPGQLAFQVLIPAGRVAELEALKDDAPTEALLAAPLAACRTLGVDAVAKAGARTGADGEGTIQVGGESVCATGVAVIGDSLCFAGSLVLDFDQALAARVGVAPVVSLWQLLGTPPDLAAAAEALISAFESCYGLTMVPAMPTPDELDAILEQDARLAADAAHARQPEPVH